MADTIDAELLKILACPLCKGKLDYKPAESKFACAPCKREYPIVDGIPNFLVE